MLDRKDLTKRYYSISEVASLLEVAPSLLRFWETVFPTIKPVKSHRGERRYTPDVIMHLQEIYTLVKVKGYTLDGAKSALQDARTRRKSKAETLKKLRQIREKLNRLLN